MFHKNKKYFIAKIPTKNLNFDKIFNIILSKSINKWKEINQINTSLINKLVCEININNINELQYVRSLLNSNFLIQDLNLQSIKLNSNLYAISFVGTIDNFNKSLQVNRLSLIYENELCNIKLI